MHPVDAFGPGLAAVTGVGWTVYGLLAWRDYRKRRRATYTVDEFKGTLAALEEATRQPGIADTPHH